MGRPKKTSSRSDEKEKTNKKTSSSTTSISKYFVQKGENGSDLNQTIYKTESQSGKREKTEKITPEFCDDSFDFVNPSPKKKLAKIFTDCKLKTPQKVLRSTRSTKTKKTNVFKQEKQENINADINGEHLQLALALSESSASTSSTQPSNLNRMQQNARLELFGFRINNKNTFEVSPRPTNILKKKKKSKFQYITPTLKLRTDEDRQRLIEQKINEILNENYDDYEEKHAENTEKQMFSFILRNYRSKNCECFKKAAQNSENEGYFLDLPGISADQTTKCGSLLKDWHKIIGRDVTPEKQTKSIVESTKNEEKSANFNCEEENNFIAKFTKEDELKNNVTPENQKKSIVESTKETVKEEKNENTEKETEIEENKEKENNFIASTKEKESKNQLNEDEKYVQVMSPDLFMSEDDSYTELETLPKKTKENINENLHNDKNITFCGSNTSDEKSIENLSFEMNKNGICTYESYGDTFYGENFNEIDVRHEENHHFEMENLHESLNFYSETAKTHKPEEFSINEDLNVKNDTKNTILEENHSKTTKSNEELLKNLLNDDSDEHLIDLSQEEYSKPIYSQRSIEKNIDLSTSIEISDEELNYSCVHNEKLEISHKDDKSERILTNSTNHSINVEDLLFTLHKTSEDMKDSFIDLSQENIDTEKGNISVEEAKNINISVEEAKNINISAEKTKKVNISVEETTNDEKFKTLDVPIANIVHSFEAIEDEFDQTFKLSPFTSNKLNILEENVKKLKHPRITQLLHVSHHQDHRDHQENSPKITEQDEFDALVSKKAKIFTEIDDGQGNNSETPEKTTSLNKNCVNLTPDERIIIKTMDITPMTDYNQLSTPQIHKELQKFGLKSLKRHRGIQMLEYIYNSTHPHLNSTNGTNTLVKDEEEEERLGKRRKKLDFNSSTITRTQKFPPTNENEKFAQLAESEPLEAMIFETKQSKKISMCRVPFHIVWFNFLRENPEIRKKILLYEPLQVEALYKMFKEQGYNYHINDIITFLDSKCITIAVNQKSKQAA